VRLARPLEPVERFEVLVVADESNFGKVRSARCHADDARLGVGDADFKLVRLQSGELLRDDWVLVLASSARGRPGDTWRVATYFLRVRPGGVSGIFASISLARNLFSVASASNTSCAWLAHHAVNVLCLLARLMLLKDVQELALPCGPRPMGRHRQGTPNSKSS
jgi:hypothetical protein